MDERTRLIEQIVDNVRDVGRTVHSGLLREWIDTEITMPQLKTLMVLYCMGRASMGELADALGTGVSTVTGVVDRLVDHGFVMREEDPRDRRVVVVRLTPAGVARGDQLVVAARDRVGRVLAQLSDDDLRRVHDVLSLLRNAATKVYGPPAPWSELPQLVGSFSRVKDQAEAKR
jgi:DNA-binding MarR family transcriptional regulator